MPEFKPWPKLARLYRDIVVTEKIDGTNACVIVGEDGSVAAQSRTKLIVPGDDNFGFALWCQQNADELRKLGPGYHYGEWWGVGIQRGYGLHERRFSLFNVDRWEVERPACCGVVPRLYTGVFDEGAIDDCLNILQGKSVAAPGWTDPEGVVVFHKASQQMFKVTLGGDGHKEAR